MEKGLIVHGAFGAANGSTEQRHARGTKIAEMPGLHGAPAVLDGIEFGGVGREPFDPEPGPLFCQVA